MGAKSEWTMQGNLHVDPEVAILVEGGEAVGTPEVVETEAMVVATTTEVEVMVVPGITAEVREVTVTATLQEALTETATTTEVKKRWSLFHSAANYWHRNETASSDPKSARELVPLVGMAVLFARIDETGARRLSGSCACEMGMLERAALSWSK
ncbi:uncharacterized protein LOC125428511 isoform X1 [Sphaerodactylus townsendi]|uniref:uncharacterized protein LOC125428511 isoform X1 n=1 Tax=Sphaerodactylus townsendi TaxID=933632 RepID=UPI0020269F52|nr:uncharacterized protein LOC125428511 isoform X1 [Sphaerodactylus townsendi]